MITQTLPKTLVIKGSNNRNMGLDVFLNSQELRKKSVVIFCHGYKGFKDWGCWNLVGEKFAQEGFNFVKFNFSHNGVSIQDSANFVDLEAFGNNNYSKELFDLQQIVDWVSDSKEFNDFFDTERIYLIGHSRGGGIVTLTSAKDTRIKKSVTWASVSNLIERVPKETEKWKSEGVTFQLNGRTNQEMPLFYQFYENTQLNQEELDMEKWARKIKIPFCIIHGTADAAVEEHEADSLNELVPSSELIMIENAGHTFGASHPWTNNNLPTDLNQVVEESISFLLQ